MGSEVVPRREAGSGSTAVVDDVLAAVGLDPGHLEAGALLDHDRRDPLGGSASVGLAEAAAVLADDQVLAVGGGLGGPARLLADRYGSRVVVVERRGDLVRVAAALTGRVGLGDRVAFVQAAPLALPWRAGAFDVVWLQHATMAVRDKHGLYAELRRVLRPGGRLAMVEVLAGPERPLHFPVPWADGPRESAVATVAETRALLSGHGFGVRVWDDVTPPESASSSGELADGAHPGPVLGAALLAEDLPARLLVLRRNIEERRAVVVRVVAVAETT